MQLEIQSIHFTANELLLATIHEKFDKLEHKDSKIESCHIVLKKEKNDHGLNFMAEGRLKLPGNDLFASERAESPELAISKVTDDLERQLLKHQQKARR